ncbi:MAG: cytochrome c oxidase subunit II [Chromatiales bacterium]|nr:cytochrome c oxidase subunit II [Chromatiales bacterium]
MPSRIAKLLHRLFVVLPLAGIAAAQAEAPRWQVNMPVGVTPISRETYELHMLILWVCVVIGVIVFGAMTYALVKFRHSKGAVPARWSHSTTAEVIWTVIPTIIVVWMAYVATPLLIKIEDTRGAELTVKITGYQWMWEYEYIGHDVRFFSVLAEESNAARRLRSGIDPFTVENYLLDVDEPLVVPTNTKIRYLLTSNDVLHAWWVPDFAVKRDAIPGRINEGWFLVEEPGTYRGQCAELCGKDHGFMPIVVVAVPPEQFTAWLDERRDVQYAGREEQAPRLGAVN